MPIYNSFEAFDSEHKVLFEKNGYLILPIENRVGLIEVRNRIGKYIQELKGGSAPLENLENYLNNFHKDTKESEINEIRLKLYTRFNQNSWARL